MASGPRPSGDIGWKLLRRTDRLRVGLSLIAAFVGVFAAFHASMVFLVNLPSSAVKQRAAPILSRYDGPFIDQGWALFAPRPYPENIHVLVRGRSVSGALTPWYDVSKFFLIAMRGNRFTTTRALFAALSHSAPELFGDKMKEPARAIVTRTSAMILRLYSGGHPPPMMQIELDAWGTSATNENARLSNETQLPWQPVPNVATFE